MESPIPPPVNVLAPPALVGAAPASTEGTITVPTKERNVVVLEGSLYFIISALPPISQILLSDQIITARSIAGTILVGTVSGSIALKAFFSQSFSKK
jgi:hypothetical protein